MSDASALVRIRELCMALPATHEEYTWEHPNFRVKNKMYVICGGDEGGMRLTVKCTRERQAELLQEPGFFFPAYVGGKGWIGINLDGAVSWERISELLEFAWSLTAPKRLVAQRNA